MNACIHHTNRPIACFSLLLLLVLRAGAAESAVVEGKVPLPKPSPPAVKSGRYQVQSGGIAAPDAPAAVVYLEGNFPLATNPPPTVQLRQNGLQFRPALLPVQVGTTIEFPNEDDIYHNVFSYSKAKRFDLGRYRKDERPAAQVFEKPGVVHLYCEIHEHMRGTILVLETPYFTRTDTNGCYRLENLPAGSYQLRAWLDDKLVYTQPVTLAPGKTTHLDFAAPAGTP